MKKNLFNPLKLVQVLAVLITVAGSLIILFSINSYYIQYEMSGPISPQNFFIDEDKGDISLSEFGRINISPFVNFLIFITAFFPFGNAILHFITTPTRIIKSNIINWVFSPLVTFFAFIQVISSILVGLVMIFGGIGYKTFTQQMLGILLIALSILIFGFFALWKKPHETRTSSNRLVINTTRTSIITLNYILILYVLFFNMAMSGFFIALSGAFIASMGSILEWILEEIYFSPKKSAHRSIKSKVYKNENSRENEDDD